MLYPVFENVAKESVVSVALTMTKFTLSGVESNVASLPAAAITTPPFD